MCVKNTHESCVLAERMAKVETKQNFVIVVTTMMFIVLAIIAFKLLDTQIYMLTGEGGLRAVTNAACADAEAVGAISGAAPGARVRAVSGEASAAR